MENKLLTIDTIVTTIKNAKNKNEYIEQNKWSTNPPYIYKLYQDEINNLMDLYDNTFIYSSEDESNYIGQINKEAYIGFNYYKELISLNTHVNSCPDTDLSSNLQDSISQLNSFKDSFSDFKGKVLDDIDDYQAGKVESQAYPTILGLPQTVSALKTQVNNANTALSQFGKATGLDTTLLASFLDYFTETLEQKWE